MKDVDAGFLIELQKHAIYSGSGDEAFLAGVVRDWGTLDYIASKINEAKTPLMRASTALCLISNLHPFMDGNKRTALLTCHMLLKPYVVAEDSDKMDVFIREVGSGTYDVGDVCDWLKERIKVFTR
ncbi:MAG: Fic family protein [Thermoplasmatales archaeon]|nr:Fic family protein [Thermoplasmatales archaeon]